MPAYPRRQGKDFGTEILKRRAWPVARHVAIVNLDNHALGEAMYLAELLRMALGPVVTCMNSTVRCSIHSESCLRNVRTSIALKSFFALLVPRYF